MRGVVLLLVAVVACILVVGSQAQTPLGDWQYGRSTWYQGIDNGNCGFSSISAASFPWRHIAAPNEAFYANSAACGKCYEVKCISSNYLANACYGGSVVIQVTDSCPCASNQEWCCGDATHFDLSPEAFSTIANTVAGVINTQYRPVTCPVSGNLQVKVKDGSNAWWFAVLPMNVGGSGEITNVEVSSGNTGAYTSLQRQQYNYWIITTGGNGLAFPIGVRVTQGGNVVTGTIPYAGAGALFGMNSNF